MFERYWWIQVFLRSFTHYLLLPAVLLLIAALLLAAPWFGFGAAMGIPAVIRHDDPLKRLVVGFSFGVLWLAVLYCGYLLWLQDCREKRVTPPPQPQAALPPALEPADLVRFHQYALKISACFVLTVALTAVLLMGVNRLLPRVAGILHNPLPPTALEEIAVPQDDNLEPGCDEGSAPPAPAGQILQLYAAFLGTIALLLLIGLCLAPWLKDGAGAKKRAPAGENSRAWLCVWIVTGLSLIWLTRRLNPEESWLRPSIAAGAVAVAIVFREFRLWLACRHAKEADVETASAWRVAWVTFALLGYLIALYAAVTWLFSHDWVMGWAGWLVAVALTRLLWQMGSRPLRSVQKRLEFPNLQVPAPGESDARKWGRRLGLLGVAVFILICALPATQSPVPFVCFLLFGNVAVYAYLSLYFHRAMFAVGVLVLILFIASGIQAYHYRFPGLVYTQDGLALLTECASENDSQSGFEQSMSTYLSLVKKHGIPEAFQIAQEDDAPLDAGEKLQRLLSLPDVMRAREQVLAEWQTRENNNKVIPVRIPPRDFLDKFRWPADDRLPVKSKSLVPIEEIHIAQDMPVVVVAVSGGGIRSAAWAYVVLQELELQFARQNIDFSRHMRLVTGASGGMLGASYYVDLLTEQAKDRLSFPLPEDALARDVQIDQRRRWLRERYCKNLTKDCLTPIMKQLVLGDVPCFLSPWFSKYDRGQALEDAWMDNLQGILKKPFADFAAAETKGDRPFLVFTPMMVEDGRRLIISNLDMRTSVVNDGNLLPGDPAGTELRKSGIYSREALELFRMFPDATKDFRLSTAVRMSASFPLFSPAVPLPTAPRRRVVDAGYYDNYGVSLAASWLFSQRNADLFKRRTSQNYLLIQIRDTLSDQERALTKIRSQPAISPARALEEITSPIEGLYNARDGSSSFRNDGQLELLSQFLKKQVLPGLAPADPAYPNFNVVTFELDKPAPLSWYLSNAERDDLLRAINSPGHKQRLEATLDWWMKVAPTQ